MKRLVYIILITIISKSLSASAQAQTDSIATQRLQEVVVTENSAHNRVINGRLGSENLELARLAATPQLFGETDIIKSITLLPGVHSEGEGAGGFEVRGGNPYQNLVMMDGMTLYNPAHMMGIFSTFNDDAMGRAVLHKGPIPASLGGATSSALETFMNTGDPNNYHFSGTIGILNAKIASNGPIIKDRLTYSIAARRSYVDMFLKLIPKYRSTVMNFTDINAKFRYIASPNSVVDLSVFASRDNLAVSDLMAMHWGNLAAGINWNLRISSRLRLKSTFAATNYSTDMSMDLMDVSQSLTEYIHNVSINESLNFTINEGHELEFGLRSEFLGVKSADMKIRDTHEREIRSGWQNALWIVYDGRLAPSLELSMGLRDALFSLISSPRFHSFNAANETPPDFSAKSYFTPEPRGSLKYLINENHNIKAGISVNTQNIHGLRSTTTTFPFDRYALTSAHIKPETALQYSLGYSGMTPSGLLDWSVETYYKSMKNVYDYRDGMTMFSRVNLESLILHGRGRSYGLELMIRKNLGNLTGWVSYTLSRTETRIPGINDGRWYNASNDRRNDIAIVGLYRLNERWNLSASWTYSSGRPLTAPDEKYEIAGTTCYYFTRRNSYKTPPSHRLDLSANYTRVGKRATSIVSFGLFNAYGYYSPFVIFFEDDPDKPSGTRAVQQSLFGIVPSISYTIKF